MEHDIVIIDHINILKEFSNKTNNSSNIMSKMSKMLEDLMFNNRRKKKIKNIFNE